ncbi:MAG: hypothetical protein ABIG95_05225 [Candidatus Woesearchaeota archaeon]
MSLFDKFRKKPVELALPQLPAWLNKQLSPRLDRFQNIITTSYEKIEQSKANAAKALRTLESAKLMNEIPQKAEQVLAGNMIHYIKRMDDFLNSITIPEEKTLQSADQFATETKKRIQELSTATAKSFYVIQQFFGNEVGKVAKALKEIDSQIGSIEELLASKEYELLSLVDKALKQVDRIQTKALSKEDDKTQMKSEVDPIQGQLEEVKQQIATIKASQAYKEWLDLKAKEEVVKDAIKKFETAFLASYDFIDKPIRKFNKIKPAEILSAYIQDPLQALSNDNSLEITKQLAEIKLTIAQLELKEGRIEKTISKIDELAASLAQLQQQYSTLMLQKDQLQKRMRRDSSYLRLKELEYKFEYLQQRKERIKKTISKITLEEHTEQLSKIKTYLGQKIKESLDIDITIN